MRIRMITLAAGPEGIWRPGQILDVTPAAARQMTLGGFAVALEEPPVDPPGGAVPGPGVETATRERRETAVGRRQRKREKG